MLTTPRRVLLNLFAACVSAPRAHASPAQLVPVDDPIVDELRVLDLYAPASAPGLLALPHLHSGPWGIDELLRSTRERVPDLVPAPGAAAREIAARRVLRVLGRDAGDGGGPT
ncbi:MAG TPA: hypothetical protein VLV15_15505, partial [Dongiaceae bacterium]|nr:hypothetical protein [Dongiaceae bacterium]